ncbi:MAG: glycosyltransferase family 2 protein [Pirellulaceae bacterium]|nr:glycosyltransferase family 2 protein [Pirellulaceae bacterium]
MSTRSPVNQACETRRPPVAAALVSVVLPVYNEAQILPQLYVALRRVLEKISCRFEIVFVNDGSQDGSALALDQLAASDARVQVVHLSRNFGHQAAVQAGVTLAGGDCVVVMDSDLQDDPAALVDFLAAWQAGNDVVYAVRYARKEPAWKRGLFAGFYRLLNAVSSTPMPNDAGNFCLIDRCVVDALLALPERDRYFPGLRQWVGFRQTGVPVERQARYDDQPRVSLWGLVKLAKTALFSFSSAPLAMFYGIAALSLAVCGAFTTYTLYHKCITGLAIPGWTSLLIVSSFFGALNALAIGILGEYVVRIYDEVRRRPSFLVARHVNSPRSSEGSFQGSPLAEPEEAIAEAVLSLQHQADSALLASHGMPSPGEVDASTGSPFNVHASPFR